MAGMTVAAQAVEIDGRIDPVEWQDARHVTDFRKVQPLGGAGSSTTAGSRAHPATAIATTAIAASKTGT